jgi:SNF2 family DNA or RNA helicase
MLVTIAPESNHLEITGIRFYGENYQKLIALPDRRSFKNGRFIFFNCHSNIAVILEKFPYAEWVDGADKIKEDFYAFKESEKKQLENKDKDIVLKDYPHIFKTKPFDHQLKAFEISKDLPNYGLFFEQGCGKTKVIIDNSSYLYLENKIQTLVIIAPNGVHKNWITDELPTHCKVDYDAFCWEGKLNIKEKKKFDQVYNSEKLQIFSFNVECFVSTKQQDLLLNLLKTRRCLLTIDESQAIKNPSAKRTKFLVNKASKEANYKRIMSGTPITNGVQDIFSQFQFLSSDIIGLTSFFAFKNKYCRMGGYMMKQIIGYQGVEELQSKIQAYTTRVLKKDCLDLPEKLYQRSPFDITEEQRKIYNEIKQEGITFIKNAKMSGEPITFDNVLSRLVKMQQVICGYMLNIEENDFVEIVSTDRNPRLNRLKDLLEKIEGKVIIWARFTKDIDYIMNILGNKAVRYDGKVSNDDRNDNKYNFQNNPEVKYFVAKPIKGLTLTAATTAIYYSNDFDLEKRLQSEDRNHRFGTKEIVEKEGKSNVLYIDIEATNTLDKKIITALRNKKKLADMVLQDPESLFMEN